MSALNDYDGNRLNLNGNNFDDNSNDHAFGIALVPKTFIMKTYTNLYPQIYDLKNLICAAKKARKGKTKKLYVKEFEEHLAYNLKLLHDELKQQTYQPRPLVTFILRDPKTRTISKADFRDRVVHHALVRVIEPLFDKLFIYDSCANRKGKGNLFALKRFEAFVRKVSRNGKINGWFTRNQIKGYCLKADIKHYFQTVDHEVLLQIIQRKIADEKVMWLIKRILTFEERERERETSSNCNISRKGMPLGNLTSQFFANIYLNELDQSVKHELKAKFYIRYVDDFVLLHASKSQLQAWQQIINTFLRQKLKLTLHPEKSRIIPLAKGIDFVGFRNFYYFRLLRKRNIKNMQRKIKLFKGGTMPYENFIETFQGWEAYAQWANNHRLIQRILTSLLQT
ncbi:MAG: hypothetical protein RL557_562 [archaeon]